MKSVVVLFFAGVAVPVYKADLVHDKMNMGIIRVRVYGVKNLIFRCIVLNDFVSKFICLFRGNVFFFIKGQNGVP